MANNQRYTPDSEVLGRRRFPDDKSFRTNLFSQSSLVLNSLLDLLPSNYPLTENSNLSQLLRVLARESARLRADINAVDNDKVYTTTRPQFLQQILGERLFLNERIAPASYNDEIYRQYLIAIKDAYLVGSTKENIEQIASRFTRQVIRIKELYLEARKPLSSYDVHDTHKMIVEVHVDDLLSAGRDLATLAQDLDFFVNLIRPAHVLYDTNFIWNEIIVVNKIHDLLFGDTGGGCVPVYDYKALDDKYVLARQIMVQQTGEGATGRIGSIHHDDLVIFLDDQTRVIVEPGVEGTQIYAPNGRRIPFDHLRIGQWVKITSVTIPGDFKFWYTPPGLSDNPNARFYRSVYRRPAFQEFVKKVMDSNGRFPLQIKTTPTTICDRWVQDLLQPLYEDLRRDCTEKDEAQKTYTVTLAERMWTPRFSYENLQGTGLDRERTGDIYSFTMSNAPLTDGSGGTADPSDITVLLDGSTLLNSVESVDSSSAFISLFNTSEYWDTTYSGPPVIGQEMGFQYFYDKDGTDTTASDSFVFGISRWQLPDVPVSDGNGTDVLAEPDDVMVSVDGTTIPDAVTDLNPILGHVTLNNTTDFWLSSPLGRYPAPGDELTFQYYESGTTVYSLLWDDIARDMDDDMVFDGAEGVDDPTREPAPRFDPLEIGYKYRAYHLHHTSVLNSPDTLKLNNYQKPVSRASLINQQDSLNHTNLFFSPEFLTDTDPNLVLDDRYIEQETPEPVLKLGAGTPPFQKTFSYHPDLIYHRKLKDIRQHRHPLMYSDLLLKEFREGDESIPLTSICDSAGTTFKIRYNEELNKIEECEPWILFDTAETELEEFSLPGESQGVPNLRVSSKKLRNNFILRQTEEAQTYVNTYTVQTPEESAQTVFQLPETIPFETEDGFIGFPALPIMKDALILAGVDDITVKLNGTTVQGLVKSLNPVTGEVELFLPEDYYITEYVQLTAEDITRGEYRLSSVPKEPDQVAVNILTGTAQLYGYDFYVVGRELHWEGSPIEDDLTVGDILRIQYPVNTLVNTQVQFIYRILSTGDAEVINKTLSRILDYDYVFSGECFDGYSVQTTLQYNEYINFLDDYSHGIKIAFFNKDTYQIEEHVFSGPIFETYDVTQDQISAPESFPNALVRIRNPIHGDNPLTLVTDYDFIQESQIRIRKKTFRELLPDRTFRTLDITEALPV